MASGLNRDLRNLIQDFLTISYILELHFPVCGSYSKAKKKKKVIQIINIFIYTYF